MMEQINRLWRPAQMKLLSNRIAADRDPTRHSFDGRDFFYHGCEPDLPPGSRRLSSCAPRRHTAAGTTHLLRDPNNNLILMIWIIGAWRHPNPPNTARRVAFSANYLGAAGWSYERPVD